MTSEERFMATKEERFMTPEKHFTLEEFTRSATAKERMIDNKVPVLFIKNAYFTLAKMEEVRTNLNDNPIIITSGYRSEALNKAVGGASSSQHMKALAVDFVCPKFGTPFEICLKLIESGMIFDKLICEFGRWVHIGFKEKITENRMQVLTAKKKDGKTVYLNGLEK